MEERELLEQRANQVVEIIRSKPTEQAMVEIWGLLNDLNAEIAITISRTPGGKFRVKAVDVVEDSEDDFQSLEEWEEDFDEDLSLTDVGE